MEFVETLGSGIWKSQLISFKVTCKTSPHQTPLNAITTHSAGSCRVKPGKTFSLLAQLFNPAVLTEKASEPQNQIPVHIPAPSPAERAGLEGRLSATGKNAGDWRPNIHQEKAPPWFEQHRKLISINSPLIKTTTIPRHLCPSPHRTH